MLEGAKADLWNELRVDVQQMIIKKCEQSKVIKKYNTLNQKFVKRVKDENSEMDEKNVNEKQAQKSPKQKSYQKKRGVES